MDNVRRMKRQLALLDALMVALAEGRQDGSVKHLPSEFSFQTAAVLVLAARVEELEEAVTNGLPTAGEGI